MVRDDDGSAIEEPDLDDEVDLSFAGPEPVAAAAWPMRLFDVASAYLPIAIMAVLATATWWLVRNAAVSEPARVSATARHEIDYVMTNFLVQRFGPEGKLRTQIEGVELRHFADDDTIEVDDARIRAIGSNGAVTLATARRALSNGDGSEVQLIGDAHVTRPSAGAADAVEFRGDFLQAFRNLEQVRSHLPVVVTQGANVVHAESMTYDNLTRIVDLEGRTSATFAAPQREVRR